MICFELVHYWKGFLQAFYWKANDASEIETLSVDDSKLIISAIRRIELPSHIIWRILKCARQNRGHLIQTVININRQSN